MAGRFPSGNFQFNSAGELDKEKKNLFGARGAAPDPIPVRVGGRICKFRIAKEHCGASDRTDRPDRSGGAPQQCPCLIPNPEQEATPGPGRSMGACQHKVFDPIIVPQRHLPLAGGSSRFGARWLDAAFVFSSASHFLRSLSEERRDRHSRIRVESPDSRESGPAGGEPKSFHSKRTKRGENGTNRTPRPAEVVRDAGQELSSALVVFAHAKLPSRWFRPPSAKTAS